MNGEAIVIGAGIVGACCAYRMARDGWRVTVLDSRSVAAGASGAGMGHIVVMDDPEAELALTRVSRGLWDEVLPQLPPEAGWRRCGTLWIAADVEEMAAARMKADRLNAAGVEAAVLSPEEVGAREPNLRTGLAGGVLVPGDSIVLPPAAAMWLLAEAGVSGSRLLMGRTVAAIEGNAVVLENGIRMAADAIVNAAGIWARDLAPGLPLRARKGHLVMTESRPGFCSHQIVELGYIKKAHAGAHESISFNVQPCATGNIVIGSSRQFDVESEDVEARVVRDMLASAKQFMPGIANLRSIREWTGLRASTRDGLPIIGRHPSLESVYFACGHEGLGLTMATGTAELITCEVAGRTPPIDPTPYSPARFSAALRGTA